MVCVRAINDGVVSENQDLSAHVLQIRAEISSSHPLEWRISAKPFEFFHKNFPKISQFGFRVTG